MVIYKFKNFAAASQWFYSKEHQEVSIFRNAVTEGWATIRDGHPLLVEAVMGALAHV